MEMNDFPLRTDLGKHDGSSIHKTWAIIQVKSSKCGLACEAYLQPARLNIHVGSPGAPRANLIEDLSETGFIFNAALSALREVSRIKHRSVALKKDLNLSHSRLSKGRMKADKVCFAPVAFSWLRGCHGVAISKKMKNKRVSAAFMAALYSREPRQRCVQAKAITDLSSCRRKRQWHRPRSTKMISASRPPEIQNEIRSPLR
jgi:hypothetical protein